MRHIPASPWRTAIGLVLVLVFLYAVLPQIGVFHSSLHLLVNAHLLGLFVALVSTCLTFVIAALKYQVLALKPLKFGRTLLLQVASMLANRLLPAGVGGMGVNYMYLKKARHTPLQAGAVISLNTLLGFVGHMFLVAVLLILYPSSRHFARLPSQGVAGWGLAIAGMIAIAATAYWLTRKRWRSFEHTLWRNLSLYRRNPLKIVTAIGYSMLLASVYALILMHCALALHISALGFGAAMVVLTFGVTASAITPTPGGLVGVEAGLVLALLAYGISRADALAIALLYRFFTFWLALALGAMAFIYAENRKYI